MLHTCQNCLEQKFLDCMFVCFIACFRGVNPELYTERAGFGYRFYFLIGFQGPVLALCLADLVMVQFKEM